MMCPEVKKNHWGITVGLLIGLIFTLVMSFKVSGASLQLGGWLSSKLFDRTGSVDTQMLFARSGSLDTFIVFATSPTMVTGTATGSSYTPNVANSGTATLNGIVSNMNGMPSATVGFRWGYDPLLLTANTSTVIVNSPGAFSIGLTGINQTLPVYFQAFGVTDGIAYGLGDTFTIVRSISSFTGFNTFLLIVPMFIWLALLYVMGVLIWSGIKDIRVAGFGNTEVMNTALFKMAIAIILMVVAILVFQLIPEAIQRLRIV